jgi:hypothetical protein
VVRAIRDFLAIRERQRPESAESVRNHNTAADDASPVVPKSAAGVDYGGIGTELGRRIAAFFYGDWAVDCLFGGKGRRQDKAGLDLDVEITNF